MPRALCRDFLFRSLEKGAAVDSVRTVSGHDDDLHLVVEVIVTLTGGEMICFRTKSPYHASSIDPYREGDEVRE